MTTLFALLGILAPTTALAQDDTAAGLFTEARQLPLVSQAIAVEVDGDDALLHLTQVFANDGEALAQADYALRLPESATVEGFGFWHDDRYLEAALQEREAARTAHHEAAAEGRATALLHSEGRRELFSVYPVEAHGLQQVEVSLRLPVEVEGGRRELLLPVDHFLGQAGPVSTVSVRLRSPRPVEEVALLGTDGSALPTTTLARGEHHAMLATSSRAPIVLRWQEDAPPLDVDARRVDTPDGQALGLRVSMQEAPARPDFERVELFVDGSRSMKRRRGAVDAAVARVQARSTVPVMVHGFADGSLHDGVLREGRHATWDELRPHLAETGCGSVARCVVLTDAQLLGIAAAEGAPAELIVLADSHELAFFDDALPPRAARYQPGVEPLARLLALIDAAVLPVLEIDELRWGDTVLEAEGPRPWRVAEGGLLRLHAIADIPAPDAALEVQAHLGTEPLRWSLPVNVASGSAGSNLRRAAYRDRLAAWMHGLADQPDDSLRQAIVDLSLREGIPTALTSLQVDDPELSLVAIKPGDPTLRVDGAPGVTDVLAWYPFGDMRRLQRDGEDFSDRFLVPRAWDQRAYRVEVFSRHADGEVTASHTWYLLDETLPDARLSLEGGALVVDTGDATPDIGAVELHADGRTERLHLDTATPSQAPHQWRSTVPLAERFTVVVRDRAGNVLRLPASMVDGTLSLPTAITPPAPPPLLDTTEPPLRYESDSAEVEGHTAVVHLARRSLHFDLRGLHLRSLRLTAALDLGDRVLLGTRGGDLLDLRCAGVDCVAAPAAVAGGPGTTEHPITGLVLQPDGRVLVGVLGQGVQILDERALRPAPVQTGSRFVTGLAQAPDGDVLVGTAYDGLWRLVDGRALKSRFPHDHVAGIRAPGDPLAGDPVEDIEIDSGFGRFLRLARDRFSWAGPGLNARDLGADDLVDLVQVGDTTFVAGFDSGLWRRGPEGELTPLGLPLSADDARINRLALFDDRLWLATDGGLLSLDPDRPERGVQRHLDAACHDLSAGNRLAVASTAGLFVLDADTPRRIDIEGPMLDPRVGSGRYLSVAWHEGALWAGTLDGLLRATPEGAGYSLAPVNATDGFEASWVTALLSDGDRLWVGTYADGLWEVGERPRRVAALANQWVPPGALRSMGDALWVGGIGMPSARLDLDTGRARAIDVPVRDVNAALPLDDGGLLLATSDGLVEIGAEDSVASR